MEEKVTYSIDIVNIWLPNRFETDLIINIVVVVRFGRLPSKNQPPIETADRSFQATQILQIFCFNVVYDGTDHVFAVFCDSTQKGNQPACVQIHLIKHTVAQEQNYRFPPVINYELYLYSKKSWNFFPPKIIPA